MVKEYTGAAFLRHVICSLSTLIVSVWPMLLALFAYGETMPILKLVKVFTDDITLNINNIIFIMAFFAILILLIMTTGWIFNISSNLFLKILVIIGCICGIPNTIISLILYLSATAF
jgi:sorbitol-specific phosphotransferase system component IIBC